MHDAGNNARRQQYAWPLPCGALKKLKSCAVSGGRAGRGEVRVASVNISEAESEDAFSVGCTQGGPEPHCTEP